jgi:hypothetical protein
MFCRPALQQILLAYISGYRNMQHEWKSVFQLFKTIPTFYEILRLITRFTRVHRLSLSTGKWIHAALSYPFSQ